MTDELVAVSWAQWRSAGDFATAAQAAVDAVEPAQRAEVQESLVAQLLDAACVGEEPSALLIEYFEHGMMLGALPINLSLRQLLASPLLAVETPVRLRAALPVLHSFAPHVTPDTEEAAELVLQVLIKLAEVETAGVAPAEATDAARVLLGSQAVLPLIVLARHIRSDTWQVLLEQLRRRSQAEPAALSKLMDAALMRLGLRLEDDTRIPPRPETLALHDEDMGTRTLSGRDDDAVGQQRRVRPRVINWGACKALDVDGGGRRRGARGNNAEFLPLPQKRTELEAMVNSAMVSALSSAAADGHKTAKAFGAAIYNIVAVVAQRVCDALAAAQALPWHEARALAQLLVTTVNSVVRPPAVAAALATAAVNPGGFSPEKDALKSEFSGELSVEDVASISVACGEAFKATAKVLSAPPQRSPTLPLALEILVATDAALSSTSDEAADLQLLRQALLGWTETPRLALATSWVQHEQSTPTASTSGTGDSNGLAFQGRALRGLIFFDLSSSVGRKEILSFAKTCSW